MKSFLVFAFADYYPQGGWNDLHAGFNDYGDAVRWAKQEANKSSYTYQVVDLREGKIVYEVGRVFESPEKSHLKEKFYNEKIYY